MGHRAEICKNLDSDTYDAALVRRIKNKGWNIEEFQVTVKKYIQREQCEELENDSNRRAKDLLETLKVYQEKMQKKLAEMVKTGFTTKNTTSW